MATPSNTTTTASQEFNRAYARTLASLQKELEIVIAQSIKASRAFAREEMARNFTNEVAKEHFPHEEMSVEEIRLESETWAENALEESLNFMQMNYRKTAIMKESEK